MPLTRDDVLNQARREIQELSVEELKTLLDQRSPLLLLDVRGKEEVEQGYIAGAIHIPRGLLELDIERVAQDRSTPVVVYCAGGVRSALAAKTLQEMGYTNVVSMAGGFSDWRDSGFPVAQPEEEASGFTGKKLTMSSTQGSPIISGIGHTGIVVRDMDQSIAFYCDVLGLELQARGERHGEYIATLVGLDDVSLQFAALGTQAQPHAIELLAYSYLDTASSPRYANSIGCNHVQFFVQDIEVVYRELSERGVVFNSAPLMVPTGTKKAVYLRDPDGTIIEFNQVLTGSSAYQGEETDK